MTGTQAQLGSANPQKAATRGLTSFDPSHPTWVLKLPLVISDESESTNRFLIEISHIQKCQWTSIRTSRHHPLVIVFELASDSIVNCGTHLSAWGRRWASSWSKRSRFAIQRGKRTGFVEKHAAGKLSGFLICRGQRRKVHTGRHVRASPIEVDRFAAVNSTRLSRVGPAFLMSRTMARIR